MKAPPRVTLSAGSGLFDPVFVEWEQSTTDCHSALPRQAKIDERSGNVDENKGQPISVDCRSADRLLPTADLPTCRLPPPVVLYVFQPEVI